jgi:hypothetical protein
LLLVLLLLLLVVVVVLLLLGAPDFLLRDSLTCFSRPNCEK